MSSTIKAVLVKLSIRTFSNTRQDAQITDEVRKSKELGHGAGRWIKHLFPEEAFAPIREAAGDWRRRHYDLTLPWEEGYRLLPAGAHEGYEAEFNTARALFWSRFEQFNIKYDEWFSKAKEMHNGTFDKALYPSQRDMQKHFGMCAEFCPIPKASHFIQSGIASEAVEAMKKELEERNQKRVQAAVEDTWNRLMTPVQAIADKLSDKESIFRDSLIANVKQIVGLIPSLNLTGDSSLAKTAKAIEDKFANIDPEALRTNKEIRKDVCAAARAMLKNFGEVGKRRFA